MKKLKLYLNYLTYLICRLFPKRKDRWVFGAWYGNRVSDNSYALYRYITANHPEIDAVWICNDPDRAKELGVQAVRRNSLRAILKCLSAGVSVMNQGYMDFGNLNWVFGSYKVQLWHGIPWKRIGEDTADEKTGLLHMLSHKTFLFASRCDLYIAPSDETRKVIASAFLTDDAHILSVGQPRNEVLLDEAYCKKARSELDRRVSEHKKVLLYMPTFRDKASEPFSFMTIADMIEDMLVEHDAILLEKQHYVDCQRGRKGAGQSPRIVNVADYETQDLLAASDVLITDYSSCFFDYLLRDRPIIHYLYDFDRYRDKDRGLYYSADYVVAGPIALTREELIDAIRAALEGADAGAERRKLIRDRFDTYESKDNSRIVYENIIGHMGRQRRSE